MSAFQLGLDRSGNANHFNVAGVSETDRVIDTPTNNFAVFNKLIGHDNTAVYSEGNLSFKTNTSGGQDVTTVSTIQVNTGKWYAEFYTKASSRDGDFMVGIAENPDELNRASKYMGETGNSYGYYIYTGDVYNGNGSNTDNYGSQGDNALNNDSIFSVAVDFDANKIWFANNGTFQQGADPTNGNNSVAIAADVTYGIGVSHATGGSNWVHWIGNYGQDSTFAGNKTRQGYQDSNSIGDFFYAPPAGFLALCTENLSDPDIIPTDYFSAIKYDGNATDDRTVTGVGFSPGFVWSKAFTTTYNHFMVDTVRGVNAYVNSNRNNAESSDTDILKSFDADGYTLGNSGNMNESGHSHAAWNWKSGGSGSANNAGNNNATVSVVTEAKFSIVAGTGDDMQMYHDGSNSYLTNSTGALKIATETSGIAVTIGHSTSEVTIADNATVAGNLTVTGTLTQTGTQTFDGGIDVDNFNLNGTTLALSSGDMTVDVAGDIILDADGGDVFFKDAGTTFGSATNSSGNLILKSGTTTAATFSGANVTFAGTLSATSLTADDVAIDGKVITMTGSSSDTAVFTAGTNGTLSIVTTDAAAAAANITITADGTAELAGTTVTLNSSGGITLDADGGTITFADAGSSLGTITSSGYSGTAAVATTVTITDNESTNENNAIIFTAGGDVDGGNIGLESDGDLTYNPSTGTLNVTNISVTGTQTIVNSVTMNASNAVIFEGATADAYETTLSTVDATADRTINLPNQSGTLPVLAAASATAITSTPEELNKLDGATVTVGEINLIDGDAMVGNQNSTTIGYNAQASSNSVDNEITLGDANITALRCADTSIAALSDGRDKTDVVDLPHGLDFINQTRPVRFKWDIRDGQPDEGKQGTTNYGFIAQELLEIGNNEEHRLVYESNPDKLEARYNNLIPMLTKAIQELSAKNDSLETSNQALIARIEALENA